MLHQLPYIIDIKSLLSIKHHLSLSRYRTVLFKASKFETLLSNLFIEIIASF